MKESDVVSPETKTVRCPLSGEPAQLVATIPVGTILDAYRELEASVGPLDVGRFFGEDTPVAVYRSPRSGYQFYYPFDLAADEEFYRRLARIPWYYEENKWEYDAALGALNDADSVLEVGCGRGAFLRKVVRTGGRVVGIELNQEAVSFCLANGLDIWSRSIEDLARESPATFDAVVSFQVLEHLVDPLTLLEAATRLLRRGGRLILSVPNNDSALFKRVDPLNAPPHHMGLWNLRSLLWLQNVLPIRPIDVRYQPLLGALPLRSLLNGAERESAYRSRRRRLARRLLGEDGLVRLAAPWIEAALALAPGHTIQVTYERVAG